MKFNLPKFLLHLEGATVFVSALIIYFSLKLNLMWFPLLFLVPDIGMFGYFVNKNVGAVCYNLTHTYFFPLVLFALGVLYETHLLLGISLIWFAHIGFDRAIGFGLKYPQGFKKTHFGKV